MLYTHTQKRDRLNLLSYSALLTTSQLYAVRGQANPSSSAVKAVFKLLVCGVCRQSQHWGISCFHSVLSTVLQRLRNSCGYIMGSGLCNPEKRNIDEQKLIEKIERNNFTFLLLSFFVLLFGILTSKITKPIYFKNKLRTNSGFLQQGASTHTISIRIIASFL